MKKWKCTVCNYVHDGDQPPEICPVCGADRSVFIEINVADEMGSGGDEATASYEPENLDEIGTQQATAGKTAEEPLPFGFLGSMVMKFHLHAIGVHTPNGVIPVGIVFLALAMYFNIRTLEYASFVNLIFVLLSMPVVILTGVISWKIKYKGVNTWVFKTKLACSFIVTILLSLMVIWRFIDTNIAMSSEMWRLVYLTLGFIILGCAGIAGHLGGTLVHGK